MLLPCKVIAPNEKQFEEGPLTLPTKLAYTALRYAAIAGMVACSGNEGTSSANDASAQDATADAVGADGASADAVADASPDNAASTDGPMSDGPMADGTGDSCVTGGCFTDITSDASCPAPVCSASDCPPGCDFEPFA